MAKKVKRAKSAPKKSSKTTVKSSKKTKKSKKTDGVPIEASNCFYEDDILNSRCGRKRKVDMEHVISIDQRIEDDGGHPENWMLYPGGLEKTSDQFTFLRPGDVFKMEIVGKKSPTRSIKTAAVVYRKPIAIRAVVLGFVSDNSGDYVTMMDLKSRQWFQWTDSTRVVRFA